MRVFFERLRSEFKRVLISLRFAPDRAAEVADIFARNSLDGVYSHGLDRFPIFVGHVKDGSVDPDALPVAEDVSGPLERYDGRLGPGVLNARFCMQRAIELSKVHGIGCVALRNTNHWMRGGTYGWQAAEAGCIGICFTNTIAIMPPWGGKKPTLGNNPLVIAVPREEGHVVLDMAQSQYSYGKMAGYQARNEQLPYKGGWDENGEMTTDPATIIDNKSALPIGFWKGSGLAMMIDLLATILSKGRSTADITAIGKESGVSQVFICLPAGNEQERERILSEIIAYTRTSGGRGSSRVAYPGENTLRTRDENSRLGIPVNETAWQKLLNL